MALKIRLKKMGRTNRAFFRLVVAESRSPRDGKYIEMLGWYNPFEKEGTADILINQERLEHWLDVGAQLTEKAEVLVLRTHPAVIKERKQKAIERKIEKKKRKKTKK